MTTESARAAAERIVGGMHVVTGGDGPYLIDSIEAALTAAHAAGRRDMREEAAELAETLRPVGHDYPARGHEIAAAIRNLKVEEG